MKKLHYADERSTALPCGQSIEVSPTTDDRSKVTCKHCLGWLAEGWRD